MTSFAMLLGMAKKPSPNRFLDALAAIQKFILGASEGEPLSSAVIRKQRDAVDLTKLEAEVERLSDKRSAILVEGTDEELAAIDAEIAAADRAADRGKAYLDRLDQMLAAAEDREAEETLSRKRAEAEALAERAIAEIDTTLRHAFGDIRRVIGMVIEAETAVETVNGYLPIERHVTSPEHWRNSTGGGSDTVLSRKTVSLWTYESSGERVGEREVRTIIDQGGGRGYLPSVGAMISGSVAGRGQIVSNVEVVRRKFFEVTFLPTTSIGWLGALTDAIKLPPLRGGEPAGWDSGHRNSTLNDGRETLPELIARIDRESARGPADDRRAQVRFEPCADEPTSDEREAA